MVLDLRDEELIHPTNRFMVYALHPRCTVSVHVLWGLRQQNTVFAVGRSIIDRSSSFDIGRLMLAHGGGGHEAAGHLPDRQRARARRSSPRSWARSTRASARPAASEPYGSAQAKEPLLISLPGR